jgi:general secretion pathway protein K
MMPAREGGEQGFAVLSAVMALSVLLLLVSSMIMVSGLGAMRARIDLQKSQAEAFSDAIVAQAATALQDVRQDARPRVDGVPSNLKVLGAIVSVQIQDEFGKVDLNAASPDTMSALFQSAGVFKVDADNLGAEVGRWTRPGPDAQTRFGTDIDADGLRIFKRTNELLLVPGMTNQTFNIVEPALTVYSGRNQIEQSVAPYQALLALPGVRAEDAGAVIAQRMSGQFSEPPLSAIVHGKVVSGVNQFGWPFRVRATFVFGGLSYSLDTIIRLTGSSQPGYVVARDSFAGE